MSKASIYKQLSTILLLTLVALIVTACSLSGEQADTETSSVNPATAPTKNAEATIETATQPSAVALGSTATSATRKIVIGCTSLPHADILREALPLIAAQGISLEIKEFADWTLLNAALNDKQLDANFFQHKPYLQEYVANTSADLVPAIAVHVEPMGAYSRKIASLDALKQGDKVGIPNDATNEGRALLLLQQAGLITLRSNAGLTATPSDIVSNALNFKFIELEASQLPRTLDEVAFSVINTNYAFEAELDPQSDALCLEGKESNYVNYVVVRGEDAAADWLTALKNALQSEQIREYIERTYKGAIVPVF